MEKRPYACHFPLGTKLPQHRKSICGKKLWSSWQQKTLHHSIILFRFSEFSDEWYPKKIIYIAEILSYTYPVYIIGKENSERFFYTWHPRMRQLVTFGELSNDVDATGIGSMRVVVSRVAISYGCPASF
jgi:hypothetical protein